MNEQVASPISREDQISALPDRISPLPDDIICIILSNLYVEESARTSILSKRWRKIWLRSPITISDASIVDQSSTYSSRQLCSIWIVNAMSHIISTHPGPIHTCRFILPIWDEHYETLVILLRTLTQKGIQNLQIDIVQDSFDVPCFVFECDSLIDVQLCGFSITDRFPAGRDIFPNLRKLTLKFCVVNDEFLANLLSSKSIIKLALLTCDGVRDVVVIESHGLQKFHFSRDVELENTELIIKDVPNLQSFKCDDLICNSKVVILYAPKLKVLSCNMGILMLQLGNYRFKFHKKYTKITGEITYMPCVRSLGIIVNFNRGCEIKSVPYLLMCFPRLETLKICMDGTYSSSYSSSDDDHDDNANDAVAIVIDDDYDNYVYPITNINCLNHHLKHVMIRNYYGIQAQKVDFVKLITANARVLETVTVYGYPFKEKSMEAQRQILMQNRASKLLRVEFVKRE